MVPERGGIAMLRAASVAALVLVRQWVAGIDFDGKVCTMVLRFGVKVWKQTGCLVQELECLAGGDRMSNHLRLGG